MKSRIQQWGNSLAVRIPKNLAQTMHISANTEVSIQMEEDRLVIRLLPHTPTLDELLSQVTKENLHGEIESGSPVGIEVW